MIHIEFSTWEQGFEILPAECPPAPCTEKTGFHRVDRTLASTGPARPVSGNNEDADIGLRPDAGSLHDRTLGESGQA